MFMEELERMQRENDAKHEVEERLKQRIFVEFSIELLKLVKNEDITPEQYSKIALRLESLLFKRAK